MAKTWKPGDPRPRPDADVPGYAPRPRGQATPKPMSNTVQPGGLKPKWTPNAGWKPARFQNPASRASIYAARSMAESVGTAFRDALRNTARSSMGPLAGGGGGGGDPKSQKKR
jgi:hypothetical protein